MPALCIIPARALQDRALTPAQLRVLLAVSIYTARGGRGAFPSSRTIGTDARVSRATVFRALEALEAAGYLRRTPRWVEEGRRTSSMYDVVLDAPASLAQERPPRLTQERPTPVSPGCDQNDREKNEHNIADALHEMLQRYPACDNVPPFPVMLRPMQHALKQVPLATILRAVDRYAAECQRKGTEPKFVRSPARFLRDEAWTQYDVPMVYGRTREEWMRAGHDVLEFDRLWSDSTTTNEGEDDAGQEG
jgi:hypothetical protein